MDSYLNKNFLTGSTGFSGFFYSPKAIEFPGFHPKSLEKNIQLILSKTPIDLIYPVKYRQISEAHLTGINFSPPCATSWRASASPFTFILSFLSIHLVLWN